MSLYYASLSHSANAFVRNQFATFAVNYSDCHDSLSLCFRRISLGTEGARDAQSSYAAFLKPFSLPPSLIPFCRLPPPFRSPLPVSSLRPQSTSDGLREQHGSECQGPIEADRRTAQGRRRAGVKRSQAAATWRWYGQNNFLFPQTTFETFRKPVSNYMVSYMGYGFHLRQ